MATATGESAPTAVLLASDGESRVLLRGLLRLQRVRLLAQTDDPREAAELVGTHRPTFLLADAGPFESALAELLRKSRATVPELRVILIAGSARRPVSSKELRETDRVLVRPFRVQQFADALRPKVV